ncbi:MAG: hypothetical protein EB060_01740 [Proteobacteria bacterium]|nr:hypothetical protein [Pseudomonadota bacterium]
MNNLTRRIKELENKAGGDHLAVLFKKDNDDIEVLKAQYLEERPELHGKRIQWVFACWEERGV